MNLLRASRVFVFEPPPGVKANLLRTFSAVPAARMCKVSENLKKVPENKKPFTAVILVREVPEPAIFIKGY